MKKCFLLAFLGLTVWPCFSQTPIYFSRHYDLTPYEELGSHVVIIPGGYAFTSPGGTPDGSTFVIVDEEGNLVLQKQISTAFNRIDGLQYQAADSTFLLWGDYFVTGEGYVVYLLKTDAWGDTIWAHNYNPPGCDFPRNLLVLPDGDMFLLCTSGINPDLVNVIKTDPEGNFLWHKDYDYGFLGFHDAWGIILTNDSTATISFEGGSIYRPYPDTINPTRLFWNGMGLIDIDFEGNVRRDSVYLFTLGMSDFTGPCYLQSNGQGILYVTAGKEDDVTPVSADMLHAFDEKTWELLWSFRFDEIDPQDPKYHWVDPYLAHFAVNKKGNVVVCGKQKNYQYDVPGSDGDSFLPWFAEVSQEGELLWQRWVGWPTICGNVICEVRSSLEHIQPTDDGGYILTGMFGLQDGRIDPWLLKVDSLGCLEPGCSDRQVIVPAWEPAGGGGVPVSMSPNPANTWIDLQAESAQGGSVRIFDAQAVVVYEQREWPGIGRIHTAALPNGMYFLQISDAFGRVTVSNIAIQH